jgi:hypothetical protein
MYNNIYIFSSLKNIINNKSNKILPIISNNIAFGIYLYKPNYYIYRLWQTPTIFNRPCIRYITHTNYIGGINYEINHNEIYIDYIDGINNDNYKLFKFNDSTLSNNNYVHNSLLEIIENTAKINNINTIKTYSNLQRYHNEFYDNGFKITDTHNHNNPYYITLEKNIY